MTREDRFRSEIIQALMCELEVDLAAILRQWTMAPSVLAPALARLHGMEADGLVRLCGSLLTVTRLGRPFLRMICASFDRFIGERSPTPRHSSSI